MADIPPLSQQELKTQLHYNPKTGIFTRLISTNNGVKTGDNAGTIRKGYILIMVLGHRYRGHNLAWLYQTGELVKYKIDHEDGDGTNNKWDNLRKATKEQNMQNRKRPKSNTTGIKGVTYHKRSKLWIARCTTNGTRKHLGGFSTPQKAQQAYIEAATKSHGEFYHE